MVSPEEYIEIWFHGKSASGKTEVYHVHSKSRNFEKLGEIRWFARWRRYAFFPEPRTIWDATCLRKINDHLWRLNNTHYAGTQKVKAKA